jgi:hypothetical protein
VDRPERGSKRRGRPLPSRDRRNRSLDARFERATPQTAGVPGRRSSRPRAIGVGSCLTTGAGTGLRSKRPFPAVQPSTMDLRRVRSVNRSSRTTSAERSGARTPVRTVSNICIPTGLHGTRVDREPRGPDAPVVSACRIRPGTPGMTVSRPSRAAPVTGRVGRRRGGGRSRAGSARRPPRPSVSGPETPRNVLRSTSRCYPLRARPGSPAFGAFTSLSRRHPPSGPCTVSACDRSPHDFAVPRPAVPHHTA